MIRHVMKDGTVKKDITGHVVKVDEKKALYERLRKICTSRETRSS